MKDLYILLPFFLISLAGIIVGPIENNWIITGISIGVISIVFIVFLYNRKEYLTFKFGKKKVSVTGENKNTKTK